MFLSGFSGHAAKDQSLKIPLMINGHTLFMDHMSAIYEMNIQQTMGGTLCASPMSGMSGTTFELNPQPDDSHWHLNLYNVSGTTLTGNSGTYISADVNIRPNWYSDPKYTLTLQQTTGGTLASNKTSGYQNDTFTLTPTPANKYTFSAYQVTGTTMTGNNGKFNTSNVTAKAVWEYHPSFTPSGEVDASTMYVNALKPSGNNTWPNQPLSAYGLIYQRLSAGQSAAMAVGTYTSNTAAFKFYSAGDMAMKRTPTGVKAYNSLPSTAGTLLFSEISVPFTYSAWYGKQGDMKLVNVETITDTVTGNSIHFTVPLISADYLKLEKDKFFIIKCNKQVFLSTYTYNNGHFYYTHPVVYSGKWE